MAVDFRTTGFRRFTEDGDSRIDSVKFQSPPHENVYSNVFSAVNKISDLITKVREQQQSFKKELKDLSEEVGTRTDALKKDLGQLEREMAMNSLTSQLEEVRGEWEVVAEKIRPLKSGHNIPGDFGMVAVYVEQAICAYVLPEVFLEDDNANLRDLLNCLNGDDNLFLLDPDEYNCEEILRSARKKWEIICENFNFPDAWKTKAGGWTVYDSDVPGDVRAIEVLKVGGVSIDFPCPIHLRYAEEKVEAMKDELPPWQFKLVAEFIGSLRDKITKTGLHHNNLCLD